MFDRSRAVWEQPGFTVAGHTTSPPVAPAMIDSVVIHYPGHDGVGDDTARDLANSQRYYATNRGYSLGYNAVVDRAGVLWQVRGIDYRNAANKGANNTSVSVQMRVNLDEPGSTAAVTRVRRFVADVERWCGHPLKVLGHRDVGATACPGDAIYNQITTGEFDTSADKDLTMKIVSPPRRVYDSREDDNPLPAQTVRAIPVGQESGAVFVNLTVTQQNASGYLTAWGAGAMPDVSNLNYGVKDICNTSWVPVVDGHINVWSYSATHVLVDVQAVAS